MVAVKVLAPGLASAAITLVSKHGSRCQWRQSMLWQVGDLSVVGGPQAIGGGRVEGTEQPLHDDYVYALRDEEAYLQADDEKPQIVEPFDPASIVCQFCAKSYEQVPRLFEAKRKVRDPNTSTRAGVPVVRTW